MSIFERLSGPTRKILVPSLRATGWTGRTQADIEKQEAQQVQSLKPGSDIDVRPGQPVKYGDGSAVTPQRVTVQRASTERDVVESAGRITCGSPSRTTRVHSTAPLTNLWSRFESFRKMRGLIFIAKRASAAQPPLWRFTTCCETPIECRSTTSFSAKKFSVRATTCCSHLMAATGRLLMRPIGSNLFAHFTITRVRILTGNRSFGANG